MFIKDVNIKVFVYRIEEIINELDKLLGDEECNSNRKEDDIR